MRSRRSRVGSRAWKKASHKTKVWWIMQCGTSGVSKWERDGKPITKGE